MVRLICDTQDETNLNGILEDIVCCFPKIFIWIFFLFVFGAFYKIVCREHPGEILTQSHFLMFTFWSKIFFKWMRVTAAATMMMVIKPYNFFFCNRTYVFMLNFILKDFILIEKLQK